jgi:hypothetical protein
MTQILNIKDDKVIVEKLVVSSLEGPIVLPDQLQIGGSISLGGNLTVANTITADTIQVKNLITDNGPIYDIGNWATNTESELNGKGFSWAYGDGCTQLMYRSGNTLWTNANLDISPESSYNIDGTPIITLNTLGSTIINSNLRKVGPLNSLNVIGDTSIGEFLYVNTTFNRVGIGTDEPSASITIIDNDVEIGIGSHQFGSASIGTYSNHNLELVTDGIPRIQIARNGDIHFGNSTTNDSVVKIHGTLYANSIVSDAHSIEFTATPSNPIYGKGLLWIGDGETKYLVLEPDPVRLHSSISIDLSPDQAYYINNAPVLTSEGLGNGIVHSNLEQVGVLRSLRVNGEGNITTLISENIAICGETNVLNISTTGITSDGAITIQSNTKPVLFADETQIILGELSTKSRPVKIFGQLSVGVNNPDPSISLSVQGNISFANKKFITGTEPPISGIYYKGDICWHSNPSEEGNVGWICILDGTPGEWRMFGTIGTQ